MIHSVQEIFFLIAQGEQTISDTETKKSCPRRIVMEPEMQG